MTSPSNRPPAIALMGPTASGKTDVAIELVERYPLEIISVDSAQVFRDMDIGTAKPTPEELRRAPHRLLDFLDPSVAWSAAAFREAALQHMAEITAAGQLPLLVGGTMLYFRALLQGLSPLPSADPELRARLDQDAAAVGWDGMHRRLAEVDPAAAGRIHPNDPQRIQRALEVYELTGTPLSELQGRVESEAVPYRVLKIVVAPQDRSVLHQRIEQRFLRMMEMGFVDEVRALHARGDLHADLPSIRSVGYRQAWAHIEGEYDQATMVKKSIEATRQLAKRQLTWLRREPGCLCYDLSDLEATKRIAEKVRSFLETSA